MATSKITKSTGINYEQESLVLQERQVRALEKIGASLDALTLWFEDVDKNEWSDRIQYYLAKWLEINEKGNKS